MDRSTLIIWMISIVSFYYNQAQIQLTEFITESCYGRTVLDYLDPNCTQDEVLYIRDVYTYAKRLDMSCPHEVDAITRNESECCRYVDAYEDCGMRYYSDLVSTLSTHYTNCVGRISCKVPVAWNDTLLTCNQSVFMDKTNYMRQYYHCIPSSSIANICNNPTLVGNPLYIWNDGYPATSGTCATNSGCKCTATSTNNSQIRIDVFDIRFQADNAGICLQRLHIQDGSVESEINCDNKNQFARTSVYTSVSNSIEIRYDDTSSQSGGNFWIYLEATSAGSTLAVTCSKANAVYDCSSSLPTITITVTTVPVSAATAVTATPVSTKDISSVSVTPSNGQSTFSNGQSTYNRQSTSNGQSSNSGGTSISSGTNIVSYGQSTTPNAQAPASDMSSSDKTSLTVGAAIGALLAVAAIIVGGVIYKKWKKSKARIHAAEYEEAFGNIESENVAPVQTEQLYKSSIGGTYKLQ